MPAPISPRLIAECDLASEALRRTRRIVNRVAPPMPITADGWDGLVQMFDPARNERRQLRKHLLADVERRLCAKLRQRGFVERAAAEFRGRLAA